MTSPNQQNDIRSLISEGNAALSTFLSRSTGNGNWFRSTLSLLSAHLVRSFHSSKESTMDDTNADWEALMKVKFDGPPQWGPWWWPWIKIWISYWAVDPRNPTPEERQAATKFMQETVAATLPCGICRQHFAQRTKDVYDHTTSRLALMKWAVETRNLVNDRNGRPRVEFKEAMRILARLPIAAHAVHAVTKGNEDVFAAKARGGGVYDWVAPAIISALIVLIIVVCVVAFLRQPRGDQDPSGKLSPVAGTTSAGKRSTSSNNQAALSRAPVNQRVTVTA